MAAKNRAEGLLESSAEGRIALSDFGIAKILGAASFDITAAEMRMIGTPAYLPPEVVGGADATKAADIYGLGVVIYEMIAGRTPFDILSNIHAVLDAKYRKDAPPISAFRKVDKEIAERLAQTLSREPTERPVNARGILAGLESKIVAL